MSSTKGPKIEDLKRENDLLFEAFRKESDRGVALVAAAFFDATLERLLRARFSSRGNKTVGLMEPLFDVFGPLSTFSSKIRVSYAIDLVQDWMACDLDLIRRIRNEFSHSLEPMTFRNSRITGMVDQLAGFAKALQSISGTKAKDGAVLDLAKFPEDMRSRFKFDVTCSRIGALLQAKVVVQESDAPDEEKRRFMTTTAL